MAPLARVLPALEPLTTSDTDRVELVNETIVKEVLQDPGELDFGRGSSPSRTLPSGASGALTAHVWRVCVRGQVQARRRVAREGRGRQFLIALQQSGRDGLSLGTTKTGLVYRLKGQPAPGP